MNTLKLNTLEKNILSQKEMNNLNGGRSCTCACRYAQENGSSNDANGGANYEIGPNGGHSVGGGGDPYVKNNKNEIVNFWQLQ